MIKFNDVLIFSINELMLKNLLFEIKSGEAIVPTIEASMLKPIKSSNPAKKIKKNININFFFLPLIILRNLNKVLFSLIKRNVVFFNHISSLTKFL